MKRLFLFLAVSILAVGCSIEKISEVAMGPEGPQGEQGIPGQDGQDGISSTIDFEEAENGYWLIVLENGVEVQRVFIRDGVDGKDGLDGLDGINGEDGLDGASVTMVTEQVEGGWLLFFYVDEILVSQIFVENGAPGTDGLDGTNGTDGQDGEDGTDGEDGQDGVSTTIQTELGEGGYWIIFFENSVEVNRVFIKDGINGEKGEQGEQGEQGPQGEPGVDGVCPECEWEDNCDESGTVCILHILGGQDHPSDYDNVVHINYENGRPKSVILELNLSEFVYHTYEEHAGSSSQGAHDFWYDCDNLDD